MVVASAGFTASQSIWLSRKVAVDFQVPTRELEFLFLWQDSSRLAKASMVSRGFMRGFFLLTREKREALREGDYFFLFIGWSFCSRSISRVMYRSFLSLLS